MDNDLLDRRYTYIYFIFALLTGAENTQFGFALIIKIFADFKLAGARRAHYMFLFAL